LTSGFWFVDVTFCSGDMRCRMWKSWKKWSKIWCFVCAPIFWGHL